MSISNLKIATEVMSNEEFYEAVGKNIQKFRENAKLSQADLAEQLEVSEQQVQKYEAGEASMYLHLVSSIAGSLGISIADLTK